jgi:hypothetical protein
MKDLSNHAWFLLMKLCESQQDSKEPRTTNLSQGIAKQKLILWKIFGTCSFRVFW